MGEEETYAITIIKHLEQIKVDMKVLTIAQQKIFELLSEHSKLVVTQEIEKKEYFEQDFTKVTVMGETDKSWYIIKDGKQMYLAKQFIKDEQPAYPMGVPIDLVLKEKSNAGKPLGWVKGKWERYKPTKVNS